MERKRGLCGADCGACPRGESCPGCAATNGHPFGGECIAADCVLACGAEGLEALKRELCREFGALGIEGLGTPGTLYELSGAYVCLEYPMPGGQTLRLPEENGAYLGTQKELGNGRCLGAVAGKDFLLVGEYGPMGTDPVLICYKKR
ncbi:MAG: DUF3795 domain-containing protein [Clostridia bacterium]|nr:DUF3795 domain-containing protein [Clostridia bacterium]